MKRRASLVSLTPIMQETWTNDGPTTGYIFNCGGGPVSWRSMLHSVSALSTIKAEYMALTGASKEAIWLNGLVNEMGLNQEVVKI